MIKKTCNGCNKEFDGYQINLGLCRDCAMRDRQKHAIEQKNKKEMDKQRQAKEIEEAKKVERKSIKKKYKLYKYGTIALVFLVLISFIKSYIEEQQGIKDWNKRVANKETYADFKLKLCYKKKKKDLEKIAIDSYIENNLATSKYFDKNICKKIVNYRSFLKDIKKCNENHDINSEYAQNMYSKFSCERYKPEKRGTPINDSTHRAMENILRSADERYYSD